MLDVNNPWVCLEDGEDDYVIERFELRVHGRKPLVLNNPSFSKLMFVSQQFLHTNKETTKRLLRTTILDSPEPLTAEQHCMLVMALEQHLGLSSK
ncbi:hypothetical protein [Vibrio alginolyticus]|uniref:hypothetical protein n=1 Tax=Vibrio alginolyticus TaxID=663 RepID=UPI00211A2DDB|nr:hypothetical protein [Vibrio alginolyticus]MCQ9087096.1 hypothetical protein [Vibrio alginolyticus]